MKYRDTVKVVDGRRIVRLTWGTRLKLVAVSVVLFQIIVTVQTWNWLFARQRPDERL